MTRSRGKNKVGNIYGCPSCKKEIGEWGACFNHLRVCKPELVGENYSENWTKQEKKRLRKRCLVRTITKSSDGEQHSEIVYDHDVMYNIAERANSSFRSVVSEHQPSSNNDVEEESNNHNDSAEGNNAKHPSRRKGNKHRCPACQQVFGAGGGLGGGWRRCLEHLRVCCPELVGSLKRRDLKKRCLISKTSDNEETSTSQACNRDNADDHNNEMPQSSMSVQARNVGETNDANSVRNNEDRPKKKPRTQMQNRWYSCPRCQAPIEGWQACISHIQACCPLFLLNSLGLEERCRYITNSTEDTSQRIVDSKEPINNLLPNQPADKNDDAKDDRSSIERASGTDEIDAKTEITTLDICNVDLQAQEKEINEGLLQDQEMERKDKTEAKDEPKAHNFKTRDLEKAAEDNSISIVEERRPTNDPMPSQDMRGKDETALVKLSSSKQEGQQVVYICPSCQVTIGHTETSFRQHVKSCCPEVDLTGKWIYACPSCNAAVGDWVPWKHHLSSCCPNFLSNLSSVQESCNLTLQENKIKRESKMSAIEPLAKNLLSKQAPKKGIYVCPSCRRATFGKRENVFRRHARYCCPEYEINFKGNQIYACPSCESAVGNHKAWQQHMSFCCPGLSKAKGLNQRCCLTLHENENNPSEYFLNFQGFYSCPSCPSFFENEIEWRQHMQSCCRQKILLDMKGKQIYGCPSCKVAIGNCRLWQKHLESCDPDLYNNRKGLLKRCAITRPSPTNEEKQNRKRSRDESALVRHEEIDAIPAAKGRENMEPALQNLVLGGKEKKRSRGGKEFARHEIRSDSFHEIEQSLKPAGRGRAATLPAWVTANKASLLNKELVGQQLTANADGLGAFHRIERMKPAGRGRAATLPAWLTTNKASLSNKKLAQLTANADESGAFDVMEPMKPTGRGREANLPTWMTTNSESLANKELTEQHLAMNADDYLVSSSQFSDAEDEKGGHFDVEHCDIADGRHIGDEDEEATEPGTQHTTADLFNQAQGLPPGLPPLSPIGRANKGIFQYE